jgi:soluble lytic murein transglycosylase-like protein
MRLMFIGLLVAAFSTAVAAEAAENCWESSGARYSVPPTLLYAIAKTESGLNPRAVNRANANRSVDVGLMQINSFWFPVLSRYGISRDHLFDPCTSIEVGAWILAQNFKTHGVNWKAVGAYNAATPSKQLNYAMKVYRSHVALHEMLARQDARREPHANGPILVNKEGR